MEGDLMNFALSQHFLDERLPSTCASVYLVQSAGMAGCRITPVLVFWTGRDLHWVKFTPETGVELPSSCAALP
jgi:hypothetical protein